MTSADIAFMGRGRAGYFNIQTPGKQNEGQAII
jgi:hypothetical protein